MPVSSCRVSCPGADSSDARVRAIRARGNLPLMIGERVLAEIARDDLDESWETARDLPAAKAARLARQAGERLRELLADSLASADLADMVSSAAVLYLTALRKIGAGDPAEHTGCVVSYDGGEGVIDFPSPPSLRDRTSPR
jgi:hypothetical protein